MSALQATRPIRLLIAEDSRTQCEMLSFIIEESGGFEIIGAAPDGLVAYDMTMALHPDIILMDCHMPRSNGFDAARRIMENCPTPIVMISSTASETEQIYSFEAVKVGALAFLAKPGSFDAPEHEEQRRTLTDTLRIMSEVKVVRRFASPTKDRAKIVGTGNARPKLFAMAGSTGAPGILVDILSATGQPAAPVLIVQHMAHGFVAGFAKWMESTLRFPVSVANQGEHAENGHAYLAPDDRHMGIDPNGTIILADTPPEEGFRPSADFLFRSVAESYGRQAMGILLSGMGRDGAQGLKNLRDSGGRTAVQDEASSVIFGMPGAAVALGAAQHILPPAALARLMVQDEAKAEREAK